MSTTVIASPHGLSLFLLPMSGPQPDPDRLSRVLERRGLALLPGALEGSEFIAAQGLAAGDAARLAEELRALGLTVRVVNQADISRSARIGNALAVNAVASVAALTILSVAVAAGGTALLVALPALLLGILALLNLITLAQRGGLQLPVAAAEPPAQAVGRSELSELLDELRESLPEHVVGPIVARAQDLELRARRDPQGEAAAALHGLIEELQGHEDARIADEVRSLRDDLQRARRAMLEAQGHTR